MYPRPKPALRPNTYEYESGPMVKPTGFREYDARWLLGKEINLMGIQALGMGIGTLMHRMGVRPALVTGRCAPIFTPVQPLSLCEAVTIATQGTSSANWAK